MKDPEKLLFLIKVLKSYAERQHCYDRDKFYDVYNDRDQSISEIVEHSEEYGEINFARTLLEQIGETFEYPCEKEND
jgi:hypothetical protein